jgi:sarcosine oxidase subunit delta
MLAIRCPWCGMRSESEFFNGGARKPRRPDVADADHDAWVDRLTVSPNPKGPLAEKWWHQRGCGRWFTLTRDTVTHAILADPPEVGDGG